ncbi:outer membrane protein assembly factor BamB family protein [Natrinema thermotolerans]
MERRSFLRRCGGTALGIAALQTATVSGRMLASGEAEWSVKTDGSIGGSPTIVDGTVYTGSDNRPNTPTGTVYAIDAATGDERWSTDVRTVDTSPTVVDDTVYVDASSTIRALDAETGDQLWERPMGGAVETAPTVVDGTVFLGDANTVVALDAATGEQNWEFRTQELNASTPTVVGGTVFVGSSPNVKDSDDGGIFAIDAATGDQIWHHQTKGYVASAPTVAASSVFVGDEAGNAYRIDAQSGDRLWSSGTSDAVYETPTVANGTVFVSAMDGTLHAFKISGGGQWSTQFDGYLGSPPTVAGDTVYIGTTTGTLYALDTQTGDRRWSYASANESLTGATVSNGVVYLSGDAGHVEAVQAHSGASSTGSRVRFGTFGHTNSWAGEPVEFGEIDFGGGDQQSEPQPVHPDDVNEGSEEREVISGKEQSDGESNQTTNDNGSSDDVDGSDSGPSNSADGTSGFGVLAAVAGISGAVVLRHRHDEQ